MNRKDFFKKLGLGVATIVVAPRVIAEVKPEKGVPTLKITHPRPSPIHEKLLERYGDQGNEFIQALRGIEQEPCFWDMCMDKKGDQWVITEMWPNKIVLLPVRNDQEPSKITVRRDYFDKMFTIMPSLKS